jgi:molybdopterin converting factor small subunit
MRVLFFAQTKDAAGCSEVEWHDDLPASTDSLWTRLCGEFPGLVRCRPFVRLARNGAFVHNVEPLEPDDEIALIPPVSGG